MPLLKISFSDKPENFALLVEADLTECALKTEVSMPLNVSNSFIHLATVELTTG